MPERNQSRVSKREHDDAIDSEKDSRRIEKSNPDVAALNLLYRQTDVTQGGLRLLKLHGDRSSVLRGNLIRDDMFGHIQYEPYDALSYMWGKAEATSTIEIIAQDFVHKLPITPNLEAAVTVGSHTQVARQVTPSTGKGRAARHPTYYT
jgi:hypothetical protein